MDESTIEQVAVKVAAEVARKSAATGRYSYVKTVRGDDNANGMLLQGWVIITAQVVVMPYSERQVLERAQMAIPTIYVMGLLAKE